jgi:3-oxoacyl-(acyl-carrier-protein) synthase/acyl carrier protein
VRRGGFLKNAECFDNEFFKISPREAEIMDPQHRVLLEQSWLALEDAGYIPDETQAPVGVFVGSSVNRYLESKEQWTSPPAAGDYHVMLANEKDFLATRISYKLNLKGPSVNVQSACSTGLLAVGLACKSLLSYECDMAIAGGVTITAPRKKGYLYKDGMIYSQTGYCRPFDRNADGTVFSEGVGVVCLKRLTEAVEDRDHIYAIIKAVSINNDGNDKVGFAAPSIDGQINAIRLAHALADLDPHDIGFVETHGTGTLLGDTVEMAALKEAFAYETDSQNVCYLGTLKANLGHLDAAAGVAGLIKTALIVNKGIIPPAINCDEPNPELGLEDSPFKINNDVAVWKRNSKRRFAGISSFGIGGTNVHAILEQPPVFEHAASNRSEIVLLSARSSDELDTIKKQLKENLLKENESSFNDIAYTLRECRKSFQSRWGCVAQSKEELVEKLDDKKKGSVRPAEKKEDSIFVDAGLKTELIDFVKSNAVNGLSVSLPCRILHDGQIENSLQNTLVELWKHGLEIDWQQWSSSIARRAPLPGYPLRKTPFWIISEGKSTGSTSSQFTSYKPCHTCSPPTDPISDIVTQIWRDFFKIKEIPLDQDFFSLGGDSLIGLALVEQINTHLKLKLTFGELVLHPTLGELINYIGAWNENKQPQYNFPVLFPVQPYGERPPLFLVAGAHANRYFDIEKMKSSYEDDFLSYFSMLVGSLGMDQPVYGFRPKGLMLEEKPHADVCIMARHYVRELKKIQPQGPYFIGGECIGGIVAYEMALQLQRSGEKVAQLILMDTPRPKFSFQLKQEYRRLKRHIKGGIKNALFYLRSKDIRNWKKDATPWISLLLSVVLPITNNQRIKRRAIIGSYQYFRTLLSYRPKGYNGRVTFIVNEEWYQERFLLGWTKELGTKVRIDVVPGGHLERIKKYGDISGRILRNVIDQVLDKKTPPPFKASKNLDNFL